MSSPVPALTAAPFAEKPYENPIPFASGIPLSEGNFHLVTNFTCGRIGYPECQFEKDVTDFLTNPGRGGALEAVRLKEAEVQLYFHDEKLLGYAAIGKVTWDYNDKKIPLWLLHFFGVHTTFRQQNVPAPHRYGARILGGVIEEIASREGKSLLGLYVDPENPAFKRRDPEKPSFYELFSFKEMGREVTEERTWVKMWRVIQ